MKQKATAFKGEALNGDGTAWGVVQGGALVYDCMFVERTARALARLCMSMPRTNWHDHEQALRSSGHDLSDPAVRHNAAISGAKHPID